MNEEDGRMGLNESEAHDDQAQADLKRARAIMIEVRATFPPSEVYAEYLRRLNDPSHQT